MRPFATIRRPLRGGAPADPTPVGPSIARSRRGRGDERGFTLLELMISLTLLAVMLVMVNGSFSLALRMVPRGEDLAARSARFRAATSIMTRQVRSAVNYAAKNENDDTFPYFWGDASSFSFITASPQHRGGEGLGWVTYWTDGHALWMGERLIFSAENVGGAAPDPSSATVLLDGLASVKIEYLKLEGDDGEWLESWDAMEEQSLPAAVRVTLNGVNLGKTYWVEEIPLMQVAYGLGAFDSEAVANSQSNLGNLDGNGDEDED